MGLFDKRDYYKPFELEWAFDGFEASEQMHWLAQEVPLGEDVKDWRTKLTDKERNISTQIFRFFVQGDVDVACGYIDRYLPKFKQPEMRMMLSSIAAREGVHIRAYSMLMEEIGMDEIEYKAFMEYEEMKAKHEFLFIDRPGLEGLALDIAIFSAFGEGLQLFASFVILLNFTRFGKMKGMGQIISWSIRDETLHVECMIKVFHQLLKEHPELNNSAMHQEIIKAGLKMVELEDRFIDLVYEQGEVEGLTAEEVKQYIRYIADVRFTQLGLPRQFNISSNPMSWVDIIVFGKEHTNFFENRATDYSKGALSGDWGEDTFS